MRINLCEQQNVNNNKVFYFIKYASFYKFHPSRLTKTNSVQIWRPSSIDA